MYEQVSQWRDRDSGKGTSAGLCARGRPERHHCQDQEFGHLTPLCGDTIAETRLWTLTFVWRYHCRDEAMDTDTLVDSVEKEKDEADLNTNFGKKLWQNAKLN